MVNLDYDTVRFDISYLDFWNYEEDSDSKRFTYRRGRLEDQGRELDSPYDGDILFLASLQNKIKGVFLFYYSFHF